MQFKSIIFMKINDSLKFSKEYSIQEIYTA